MDHSKLFFQFLFFLVVCPALPMIYNGNSSFSCHNNTHVPGAICEVSCNFLYKLSLPLTRFVCSVEGRWAPDHRELFCEGSGSEIKYHREVIIFSIFKSLNVNESEYKLNWLKTCSSMTSKSKSNDWIVEFNCHI